MLCSILTASPTNIVTVTKLHEWIHLINVETHATDELDIFIPSEQ